MLISELTVYDFFKEKMKMPDAEAKKYAKEMSLAEEKLHAEIKIEVNNAFEKKKNILASKADILSLKDEISPIKLEISNVRIDIEKGFRDNQKWIVGLLLAAIGLAVTIIKLF